MLPKYGRNIGEGLMDSFMRKIDLFEKQNARFGYAIDKKYFLF